VLDQRAIADPDLALLQHRRHRHHDGELLGIALEVVGHGQHALVLVAHEHDLRGLVEELAVGLGDVEAAEGQHRRRDGDDHEHGDGEHGEALHGVFLHW